MKKIYVLLLLGICLSSVEVFATAQNTSSSCLLLTSTLRVGSRDSTTQGQVSKLQQFLKDRGHLSDAPTGYFGVLTKNAVRSFQKERALETVGFVGPATRLVIKSMSCTATEQASVQTPPTLPRAVDTSKEEQQAYQVFVNGRIQIDASSVSKTYAEEMCKKMAQSNRTQTVRCVWGTKEIYAHTTSSSDVAIVGQPTTFTQEVSQTPPIQASSSDVRPTVFSEVPSVILAITPTTVPYNGGYDSFELKTTGMKSCTLYFKDEPSKKWISGGSSLGVNFSLPGFKGMTTSKSFYASCVDSYSKVFDSTIVTVTVASAN